MKTIQYAEFCSLRMSPDVLVVDVLPPVHYRQEHIPGALNLPVEQIPAHAHQRLPHLDQTIILYCGSCT